MRKRLEVVFETDEEVDPEGIRLALEDIGLRYKSLRRLDVEGLPKAFEAKGCCGRGKKSPSMVKKAKNYAKTMARWVKAGRPIVSVKVFADRLVICGGCESLKGYECMECGCPMDSKAKMNIDKLCELNKW